VETALGGFLAPVIAALLAAGVSAATIIGVVQSQVSAGNSPIGSVSQKVGDYGTNSKF
jgi:hypothetical protein